MPVAMGTLTRTGTAAAMVATENVSPIRTHLLKVNISAKPTGWLYASKYMQCFHFFFKPSNTHTPLLFNAEFLRIFLGGGVI